MVGVVQALAAVLGREDDVLDAHPKALGDDAVPQSLKLVGTLPNDAINTVLPVSKRWNLGRLPTK